MGWTCRCSTIKHGVKDGSELLSNCLLLATIVNPLVQPERLYNGFYKTLYKFFFKYLLNGFLHV